MLWLAGLLVAVVWSIANFLFLVTLLKIAVLRKSRAKLIMLLLVKFPLLYALGFLILTSKVFPVASLLAGLLSGFLAVVIFRLCRKRI